MAAALVVVAAAAAVATGAAMAVAGCQYIHPRRRCLWANLGVGTGRRMSH